MICGKESDDADSSPSLEPLSRLGRTNLYGIFCDVSSSKDLALEYRFLLAGFQRNSLPCQSERFQFQCQFRPKAEKRSGNLSEGAY